jgi:hypothetical protein
MRLIIWLAVPVGLLAAAAFFTIVVSMGNATGLCGTWLTPMLPYCR